MTVTCGSGRTGAIIVPRGGTAALCIPSNKTLKVTGPAGNLAKAAGAGICVPAGSVLVIFGSGSLDVTGGKSGSGSSGWRSTSGHIDRDKAIGGNGGSGGAGGGGGGAAIGGSGGKGTPGGDGGAGISERPSKGDVDGLHRNYNGDPGYASFVSGEDSNGRDAGTVFILGSVSVTGKVGATGSGGAGGGWGDSCGNPGDVSYFIVPATHGYVGTGGGGGGGGSGWAAPYAFGGGGRGGFGGGGGGGGSCCYRGTYYVGFGGSGGRGAAWGDNGACADGVKGSSGTAIASSSHKCSNKEYKHTCGAGGGSGNDKATKPGGCEGPWIRSSNAKVTGTSQCKWNIAESYERLYVNCLLDKFVDDESTYTNSCLYGVLPEPLPWVPTFAQDVFLGYFLGDPMDGDGDLYFDGTGEGQQPILFEKDTHLTPLIKPISELELVGLKVNGRDLAFLNGYGWRYSKKKGILTLGTFDGMPTNTTFTLSGTCTNNNVTIMMEHSANVVFDSMSISCKADDTRYAGGSLGIFNIKTGVTARVAFVGSNVIERTANNGCAITVAGTMELVRDIVYADGIMVARGHGGSPGVGMTGGSLKMGYMRLFAYGGEGGAGIGGGANLSAGGSLTISGGTVLAEAGAGATYAIGIGANGGTLKTVISGGSVKCVGGDISPVATDGKSATRLWCIRTAVPESLGDNYASFVTNMVSSSLPVDYGTDDLYPIDGRLYVWRPNGYHRYFVDGVQVWATVDNADTDAIYVQTGVTVDGHNVGIAIGDGWRWSPSTSNLVFSPWPHQMTISGRDDEGTIHPVVGCDTSLMMAGLTLRGWGVRDGVFEVTNGTLKLAVEESNSLSGLPHFRGNGLAVTRNGALEVSGNGLLAVTGGVWGAGIGGANGATGRIAFTGGRVTAVGGFEGAGIGGASGVPGGEVRISGSANVTAVGGFGAAGVGAGAWQSAAGSLVQSAYLSAMGGMHAEDRGRGNLDNDIALPLAPTASGDSLVVMDLSESALRTAVARANRLKGGRITFDGSLTGEIALTQPLVTDVAPGELEIVGGGRVKLKSAGGNVRAILHLGGTLEVSGIVFSGFTTDGCGGAVRAYGSFSAEDCTFDTCKAGEYGGAVYGGLDSILKFANCRFVGNVAECSGGAVYARRRIVAERSGFNANVANAGGSAIGAHVPGVVALAEHCSFLANGAGERGAFDVTAGDAAAVACTFARNLGEALHAEEMLYVASVVSTGNGTYLNPVSPADASIGLHSRGFHAHQSSFGSVARGTFTGNVFTGLGSDEPFDHGSNEFCRIGSTMQVYRPLTHRNKAIVQGCAIWHTPGWESVATAKTTDMQGDRTMLFGPASPGDVREVCAIDQIGLAIGTTNLLVGAVTAGAEFGSLVVTTTKDVVDPDDGVVSLREAIFYAASGDLPADTDGYREITVSPALFNEAGELTLTAADTLAVTNGRMVVINGGEDGRMLRLKPSGAKPLLSVDPVSFLRLENLTVLAGAGGSAVMAEGGFCARNVRFDGESSGSAGVAAKGTGSVALERCTVIANSGPAVTMTGFSTGHALGCTVVSNDTTAAAGSVFSIGKESTFDFANCTIAGNRAPGGACVVTSASTNDTCLVNCVLVDNLSGTTNVDFMATPKTLKCMARYTCYGAIDAVVDDAMKTCEAKVDGAHAFDGSVRGWTRYGVVQAYFRQKVKGPIRNTGAFVFHSDDWGDLGCGLYDTGERREAVRGLSSRIVWCEVQDIVGRSIVRKYVSRGSYATCRDQEYFEDGLIEVNTMTDFPEHLDEHDFDGLVTLREAVDFACANPEFRDRAKDCTIVFADDFFNGRASGTIHLSRAQLDVLPKCFENGMLRILGRPDKSVAVDGGGVYRILRTQSGNSVLLSNLTFSNGIGVSTDWTPTGGGALCNYGFSTVSNCVFSGCVAGWPTASAVLAGQAAGGAVYTAAGGNTVLERCTLRDCEAGYGGALYTAEGGETTALACTFTGNRAREGVLVMQPWGGAVASDGSSRTSLVNCTVTGNASEGQDGGVAAHGTGGDTTVIVLSSILVGNFDANGEQSDLSAFSKGKVVRTIYGARRKGDLDATWDDKDATGGKCVADVFTGVNADGAAVGVAVPVGGVTHTVFPARGKTLNQGAYARFATNDAARAAAVWCDKVVSSASGMTCWGKPAAVLQAKKGSFFMTDQIGLTMSESLLGAVTLKEKYVELKTPARTLAVYGSDDEATEAARSFVEDRPWFTVGRTVSEAPGASSAVLLSLNEMATPTVDSVAVLGKDESDGEVFAVLPDNLRPGLWYGLGKSETPFGPFVVDEDSWRQADGDGRLDGPLTTRTGGECGYYKVYVRE